MTATITSISETFRPRSKPLHYSEIVDASDSLLHWCLALIEQLVYVRSGDTIDLPTKTFPAAITRAQASLLERGYPTEFKEGGEKGFGYLLFS